MTQRRTPPRIAPLQRITAQPVTDPDQLAAWDEKRARHQEEADSLGSLGAHRLPEDRARVLDLCLDQYRRLSEADKPAFVAQLISGLCDEHFLELMGWSIATLSQDAFQQLKTQVEVNSDGASAHPRGEGKISPAADADAG